MPLLYDIKIEPIGAPDLPGFLIARAQKESKISFFLPKFTHE
jgi:hypothetical protein